MIFIISQTAGICVAVCFLKSKFFKVMKDELKKMPVLASAEFLSDEMMEQIENGASDVQCSKGCQQACLKSCQSSSRGDNTTSMDVNARKTLN